MNTNTYDFEELYFETGCDTDAIIANFFSKYENIKGDKEYITYQIKKTVDNDRKKVLQRRETDNTIPINGLRSFVKHYVIPEQNNNKEYYTYSINSFA